ncbi:hypothetical protein [Enterococcus olivae]
MKAKQEPKKAVKKQPSFSKADILRSDQLTGVERDFMLALLPHKSYTSVAEAKEILQEKLKGVVK